MEENKAVKKVVKRLPRRKVCAFCQAKTDVIDYKDINTLKKYVAEGGKILPIRMSGVCAMLLAASCVAGAIAWTGAGKGGQNAFVANADAAYYVTKEDSSVSYSIAPGMISEGLYAQLVPNDSLTMKNVRWWKA